MKNSSDTIVNRTRDLPIFSVVSQLNAPPRTPKKKNMRGDYCVRKIYCLKTVNAKFTKFKYVFVLWYTTTWDVFLKKCTSQLGFFH